jgi:uronate dehydrogenase
MKKLKVLLLGPTGRIGKYFIKDYFTYKYNSSYDLILGMRDPSKLKDSGYEIRVADITDFESLKNAFNGIDVVLNLAGNANEKTEKFEELIKPNIIGTYNVLEAARLSNVKRVIMASSVHAVKGHEVNKIISETDAPRPENFYGATKAFIEAMCHVYYKKYNLSCLAIRIGAYVSDDLRQILLTRQNNDYVISQRDMAQLFHKSILAPDKIKYAVLSGTSNNKNKRLSLESTKKLVGYSPEDDSYEMLEKVKKQRPVDN